MAFLPGGKTSHLITVLVTSTSSTNSGREKTAESLIEKRIVAVQKGLREECQSFNVPISIIPYAEHYKMKFSKGCLIFLLNYTRIISFLNI